MTHIDHSTLAAYVDGELDPELAHEVETHLAANPDAQDFVDRLHTLTGLTKMAYNAPMHDQPPQHLLDTIMKADVSPSPGAAVFSTDLHQWRRLVPLAAGVAGLLLGTFASTTYTDYKTDRTIRIAAASQALDDQAIQRTLNSALELKISGTTVTWNNPDTRISAELTPVRTFQREDKTYCREYKKQINRDGKKDVSFGIACREAKGTWKTQYLIQDLRTQHDL